MNRPVAPHLEFLVSALNQSASFLAGSRTRLGEIDSAGARMARNVCAADPPHRRIAGPPPQQPKWSSPTLFRRQLRARILENLVRPSQALVASPIRLQRRALFLEGAICSPFQGVEASSLAQQDDHACPGASRPAYASTFREHHVSGARRRDVLGAAVP
jgi:hypothetical protein